MSVFDEVMICENDGNQTISCTFPARPLRTGSPAETEQEYKEDMIANVVPDGYTYRAFVAVSSLPSETIPIEYWSWSGTEVVVNDTEYLTNLKNKAKQDIDAAAEHARCKYITPGFGQSLAYQEKSEEAADFVASGYDAGSPINLSDYPFIQAEVNATGKTPQDAADDILAQKALWISKGAAIEEARLGGKKNIDDAVDGADISSARDTAIAALEAI